MLVLSTNVLTTAVVVKRGVLGSSVDTHAQGATVETYQQDETIARVVARQSALMYARQGSFQTQVLDGAGVVSTPQDLLTELKNVIYRYQYR
jgi:signal recognition particle GTPase